VVAIPVRPRHQDAGSTDRVVAVAAELLHRVGLGPARAHALDDHLAGERAKGEPGEIVAMPLPDQRGSGPALLLLVGVGDGSSTALRRAGAALGRRSRQRASLATAVAWGAEPAEVRAHVEGILLGWHRFTRRSQPEPSTLADIAVLVEDADAGRGAVELGITTAMAGLLARDLANTPPLEKSPAWLADRARAMAAATGLDSTVRDVADLAREGFGGILAVGAGSTRPPRLIELRHAPPGSARGHVVLIGKGITFDSGGLSLKPADGMTLMKTDMSGGAAVLGAMSALAALALPLRVTALIPAAENMPSGTAQRPGDVIRHYGGMTVEVANTDAEGRLVLADALAYADAVLDPDIVIDLATLTGAITQGLGRRHAGLFTADDVLAAALERAGEAAGERVWRMPLVEDYRAAIDSSVANLRNAGDPKVSAGAITAALFLREFAGSRRWAHLDIAGTARAEADEHEVSKGGTGYGARLLIYFLAALAAAGEPVEPAVTDA
jgi:leucyl aminopeptidase